MTEPKKKTTPRKTMLEVLQPNGKRHEYISLCLASNETLEEVMLKGTPPDMTDISGWEFRGYNTLDLTSVLGFRKFKKGFYRANPNRPHELGIDGYNVQPVQNSLGEPWIDKLRKGEPIRHGWYHVYPTRLTEVDNKYPNALLINYKNDKNFVLDPTRQLRDYIVQVYPDNPDLILGKAYLALGQLRLFVSYFILERHNESSLGS